MFSGLKNIELKKKKAFLNVSVIDIWGQIIPCWGEGRCSPVHFRMLSGNPGLYPLAPRQHPYPPVRPIKNVSSCCKILCKGKN